MASVRGPPDAASDVDTQSLVSGSVYTASVAPGPDASVLYHGGVAAASSVDNSDDGGTRSSRGSQGGSRHSDDDSVGEGGGDASVDAQHAPATLVLMDGLSIQESWRAIVLAEGPPWLGVKGVYEGLANLFRSGDPHIVACTFNHKRPFEVAVDFDSPESRKQFVKQYNSTVVALASGADVRLTIVMFEGPVEQDWLAFYGRPASADTPIADTLVMRNVPGHWFDIDADTERAQYFDPASKLRTTFGQFGDIRDLDVVVHTPHDDAPSKKLSPLVTVFDVWVQFRYYDDFVAAMSAFSNCTWVSAAGEATACDASFDRERHYGDEQRRKREARARIKAKQLKLEREDLEKQYKRVRARMASLKKAVKQKWKKMTDEFEFIGTMKYPKGRKAIINNLIGAKQAIRRAFVAVQQCDVKLRVTNLNPMLEAVGGEEASDLYLVDTTEDDMMTEEERAKAEQAANAAKFGGGAALAALDASTALDAPSTLTTTAKSMGGVRQDSLASKSSDQIKEDIDRLAEYTNKPALKAINSARWAIKKAETSIDAVITELNQRLPTVAEALVTLKAFRFLEILRNHHPPLDVRGKTIFVVKDGGLLDASADDEEPDVRFQPPPTPHLHPFHESVYLGVQPAGTDFRFAADLGVGDGRVNTPHAALTEVAASAGHSHVPGLPPLASARISQSGVQHFPPPPGGYPGTPSLRPRTSGVATPDSLPRPGVGAGAGGSAGMSPARPLTTASQASFASSTYSGMASMSKPLPPALVQPVPPPWKGGNGAEQAVQGAYATHGYRGAYGTGTSAGDNAVELLLRTARRDGARVLSPMPQEAPPPAGQEQQAQAHAHAQAQNHRVAAATPPPRLPALPAGQRPASAMASTGGDGGVVPNPHQFSVQSFMVHAARAQPQSFRAHSRLVSRLNQVRTTFLHYQSIFQQHEKVFQDTWGREQAPPSDLDARTLLHGVLPEAKHSQGLELTQHEKPWPLQPATTHNYGTSRLADGSDVTNSFRLPAKDEFLDEEDPSNPFRPPTPPPAPTKTIWEPRCMGVHVIEGPYTIQDLSTQDAGRMPTMCTTHQLHTRVNNRGQYSVWAAPMFDRHGTSEHNHNDQFDGLMQRLARRRRARNTANARSTRAIRPQSPELYLRANVSKANVECEGGTILHLVDRVMFPDEFNEDKY